MKVVIYTRVSTEEQATGGVSMSGQEHACRAWCAAFGHEVVAVCSDPGVSGKSLERPGVREALGRIAAGEAAGLVVQRLDRLTRNVGDLGRLLDTTFKGAALMAVAEQLDTTSAVGRFVVNILGSVAQFARESTVERINEAFAEKRRAGKVTNANAPYGWRVGEDGETLVVNALEQKALGFIWKASREFTFGVALSRAWDFGHRPRKGTKFDPRSIKAALSRGRDANGAWRPFAVEE